MSLLLFDLDGTLYSSRVILPRAYREGIEQFNRTSESTVSVPSDEKIFNQVGKPAPEIYENLFAQLDPDQQAVLQQQIFSALLEGIQQKEGKLYPGVRETLSILYRQYDLGLVTNAQTKYMQAVLETHELNEFFGRTLCHDDAPNGHKAELVEMMLEHFETSATESCMIGDRTSDHEAARAHGVPFIHCSYGYGSREDFPDSPRIESFGELLDGDLLADAETEANRC